MSGPDLLRVLSEIGTRLSRISRSLGRLAHFIVPYLKLPGPVEIDETRLGR